MDSLKVAYLGPKGTHTYGACLKHFGEKTKLGAVNSIPEVFEEVESGAYDYGVLPIENSSEGAVTHTFDCLMSSPLIICQEIEMKIEHLLVCSPEDISANIQRVYSHPQALAQCRQWLRRNFPNASQITSASTILAVEQMLGEKGSAAIASCHAIDQHELKVLDRAINDQTSNATRFLILGRKIELQASGNDKTSLMLAQENRPGSLVKILLPFADESINLTRIESRPDPAKIWHYVFFVEMDGHLQEPKIMNVLETLKNQGVAVKVLGSYPKANKMERRIARLSAEEKIHRFGRRI
ncbi:MAG: prephenate dehydratase [Oligoflexales bacterium]